MEENPSWTVSKHFSISSVTLVLINMIMSITHLTKTHIKWMKEAIMKGHNSSLYVDEQCLSTAMMWSMDVTFADDHNRREAWDAEWALHHQLIHSYIQMRHGNWNRHFCNSVLSRLMSSHVAVLVPEKRIALSRVN